VTVKKASIAFLAISLLTGFAIARQRHHAESTPGAFDYYLLNLSWAPAYCANNSGNAASSECDPAHHLGFVVHGLWPENNDGSYPQNCGASSPVSQSIVQHMLTIMPSRTLIQHEWAKHGTCTGLAAQDYFKQIETAFHKVQVPPDYRHPTSPVSASPSEIEQKFAAANHAPAGAFRVVCSKTDLDVEACMTKDLQYRQCGSSLRDCSAGHVTLPPAP
jgi:ribonuclease T2